MVAKEFVALPGGATISSMCRVAIPFRSYYGARDPTELAFQSLFTEPHEKQYFPKCESLLKPT